MQQLYVMVTVARVLFTHGRDVALCCDCVDSLHCVSRLFANGVKK